jgi:hypothetical protein
MSAKPPIASNPTPFLPGLSPVAGKQLTAARDAGNLSSNGGALLLREAAIRLDLAQVIAGPLADLETRNPLFITHTHDVMVTAVLPQRPSAVRWKPTHLSRAVQDGGMPPSGPVPQCSCASLSRCECITSGRTRPASNALPPLSAALSPLRRATGRVTMRGGRTMIDETLLRCGI